MCIKATRTPRVSIKKNEIMNYNKILQSCIISKNVYYDKKRNGQSFTVKRKGTTLYVCFKGCSSMRDFLTSADIRNCRVHGEAIGIHNGFCERSKSLSGEANYEILKSCMSHDINDIVFTGHSAGGSIAQIHSLFSRDVIDSNINFYCFTFGSPKAGDASFKDAIEETLQNNLLRIETYNDLVCLLPMQTCFEHAGKALILKDGNVFDTNSCDNIFIKNYHNDYVDFMTYIRDQGLLTKGEIINMINDHSCESYLKNIITLIKSAEFINKR
jgi:hypothetical protein